MTWRNLNYEIVSSNYVKIVNKINKSSSVKPRKVLNNICGQLKSGQLMAVMGPSGCGKSTLLECIAGIRQTGLTGSVNCNEGCPKLRISFVPQQDEFFENFTIREVLTFASQIHSSSSGKSSQRQARDVNEMIHGLQLTNCADNLVKNCSGGQLKRLSIGQELLGNPDVLILDEPTSGLDSMTCNLVIKLLKQTAISKSMAILLTIHQPSLKVFSCFDVIYAMSKFGTSIYEGSPRHLLTAFFAVGHRCPNNYNPAEFLIDVANGDHGDDIIDLFCKKHETSFSLKVRDVPKGRTLSDLKVKDISSIREHLGPITKRSIRSIIRDPWMFGLRFFAHSVLAVVLSLQLGTEVGPRGGCPPDFDENFDPSELEAIQIHNKLETDAVFDNVGAIMLQMMIMICTTVFPTVLTFPFEMRIFVKEVNNGWYSAGEYCLGKTLADVPFSIFFPTMSSIIIYIMTGQIAEWWRFGLYLVIHILLTALGQSHGILMGAAFMHHVTAGVFLSPFTVIPVLLSAGYFTNVSRMSVFYYVLAKVLYMSNLFEGALSVIYGFDRCGSNVQDRMSAARTSMSEWFGDMLGVTDNRTGVTEGFVDNLVKSVAGEFVSDNGRVTSSVMNYFDVDETNLLNGLLTSIVMLVVWRVVAYLVVVRQARAKF